MLKIVILDDEPLALEILGKYLEKCDGIHSVHAFTNAGQALRHLQQQPADILLLDVEMPEITGVDFLKKLTDPPVTIFTTAYRNYAFDGYELGVIDFLLKPISFSRFSAALRRAGDYIALKKNDTELDTTEHAPEFIFVKSGVKRIKLYFRDVSHIQGLKDYAIIHTANENIVIKGSIRLVQEMFPVSLFIRVHKSFLVLTSKIRRIDRNRIVIDRYEIPIGRSYRGEVEKSILCR